MQYLLCNPSGEKSKLANAYLTLCHIIFLTVVATTTV